MVSVTELSLLLSNPESALRVKWLKSYKGRAKRRKAEDEKKRKPDRERAGNTEGTAPRNLEIAKDCQHWPQTQSFFNPV